MYLSNLKLWKFRRYGSEGDIELESPDLDVNFHEGLNLLTGENDSGKTAIIDAIKIVLKTSSNDWIRLNDEDFYEDVNELRIELCFEGFLDNQARHFTEFLITQIEGDNSTHKLKVIIALTN